MSDDTKTTNLRPCDRCGGPGQEEHVCDFDADVYSDQPDRQCVCNCCDECRKKCAEDI